MRAIGPPPDAPKLLALISGLIASPFASRGVNCDVALSALFWLNQNAGAVELVRPAARGRRQVRSVTRARPYRTVSSRAIRGAYVIAWISRSTSRRRFTEVADETTGPRSCPRAVMLLDRCRRTTDCAGRRQRRCSSRSTVRAPKKSSAASSRRARSTLRDGQKVEDTRRTALLGGDAGRTPAKLMPFLWSLALTEHGSIAGDPQSGSTVQLRNRHWFSYPGYAEILLGEPHDDDIKSNDPVRNPYPTVLEAIRDGKGLPREKVATLLAWASSTRSSSTRRARHSSMRASNR